MADVDFEVALAASAGLPGIITQAVNVRASAPTRGLNLWNTKLATTARSRRLNIRIVGTSISQSDNSYVSRLAHALMTAYGESASRWAPFASQAENPISGWKAQYYSGTFSTRLRGNAGTGATPIILYMKASQFVAAFSQEADGGTSTVTIQSGAGAPASVASINHSNATSTYGNVAVYTLDPSVWSIVTIIPPSGSTAFGYLESYVADAGDFGLMLHNTAYGGSGLGNHTGSWLRTALGGMATTATPNGNLGLLATAAPTDPQFIPDLVLFSGPTNDSAHGGPQFATDLMAFCTAAVANGSSVLLCIEPINSDFDTNPTKKTAWNVCRAGFYAAQAAFPDNVAVFDWDKFMSPDLSYNTHFHQNTTNVHPGDYGYGDPHADAGNELAGRLGVPAWTPFSRGLTQQELASYSSGPVQPTAALTALAYEWTDTSNPATPLEKELVAINVSSGFGRQRLWRLKSGRASTFVRLSDLAPTYGAFTAATNFMGAAAVSYSSLSNRNLAPLVWEKGKTYTIQFLAESQASTQMSVILRFGVPGTYAYLDLAGNWLVGSSGTDQLSLTGPGDPHLGVITFTYPTDAQIATLTGAGVNMSAFELRFEAPSPATTVTLWDDRIEEGASALIPHPEVPATATGNVTRLARATEPLAGELTPGLAWKDTSVSPAIERMILRDADIGRVTLAANSANTLTGNSMWTKAVPSDSLVPPGAFLASTTPTSTQPGATMDVSAGQVLALGSYGPKAVAPGIQLTADTAASSGNARVNLFTLGDLGDAAWYTLSFLIFWDNLTGQTGTPDARINLETISPTYQVGADQETWTAGSNAAPFNITKLVKKGKWVRIALKFKSRPYATAAYSASAKLVLQMLIQSKGFYIQAADYRIDPGMGVCLN